MRFTGRTSDRVSTQYHDEQQYYHARQSRTITRDRIRTLQDDQTVIRKRLEQVGALKIGPVVTPAGGTATVALQSEYKEYVGLHHTVAPLVADNASLRGTNTRLQTSVTTLLERDPYIAPLAPPPAALPQETRASPTAFTSDQLGLSLNNAEELVFGNFFEQDFMTSEAGRQMLSDFSSPSEFDPHGSMSVKGSEDGSDEVGAQGSRGGESQAQVLAMAEGSQPALHDSIMEE